MNRGERRSWDKMVRESRETSTTMWINDEESFEVHIPDTDALTALLNKRAEGDIYAALAVLLGDGDEEEGKMRVDRLREEAKKVAGTDGRVPITAWRDLMNATMADLGLNVAGER